MPALYSHTACVCQLAPTLYPTRPPEQRPVRTTLKPYHTIKPCQKPYDHTLTIATYLLTLGRLSSLAPRRCSSSMYGASITSASRPGTQGWYQARHRCCYTAPTSYIVMAAQVWLALVSGMSACNGWATPSS